MRTTAHAETDDMTSHLGASVDALLGDLDILGHLVARQHHLARRPVAKAASAACCACHACSGSKVSRGWYEVRNLCQHSQLQ